MRVTIHPTAIVSPEAELEEGVVVGPYSIIEPKVRIGRNTCIGSYVRILSDVEIGRDCRIYENTILGGEPQDHSFKGEMTKVIIGDRTIIRENVTVHRATGKNNVTRIGDDVFLMEGVHVGHNVKIGNHVTVANKSGLAGHCEVEDNANLGGMVGVHQFVKIGKLCMVGGLSKVVKDIPPFTLADGRPARLYGINRIGLQRAGFNSTQRDHVKKIYKRLYHNGLPLRQALDMIRNEDVEDPIVREIVSFLEKSRRGLAPWPRVRPTWEMSNDED